MINAKISIGKYVYKRTIVILVNINKITICEIIVYVSIKKVCVKMLLEVQRLLTACNLCGGTFQSLGAATVKDLLPTVV